VINFRTLFFCAAAVMPFAIPALADDPFMSLTGQGIPPAPANSECTYPSNQWCGNVGTAVDSNSSSTATLAYLLSEEFTVSGNNFTYASTPTYESGVQSVVAGDLIIEGGGVGGTTYTVGSNTYDNVVAVVAFENISLSNLVTIAGTSPASISGTAAKPYGTGASGAGAAAFIYTYNSVGATSGLPTTLLSDVQTLKFAPGVSSGSISYGVPPNDTTATGELSSNNPGYGIFPPENGHNGQGDLNNVVEYTFNIPAPEPDDLVLTAVMLGVVWLGMVGFRKRQQLIGRSE